MLSAGRMVAPRERKHKICLFRGPGLQENDESTNSNCWEEEVLIHIYS
jgi:hypothetical protein